MSTESFSQPENVGILPLRISQRLDLFVQLRVDCLAGLTKLLIQALPGDLVGGDGPLLDIIQLVVFDKRLPWSARSVERNAAGSCKVNKCLPSPVSVSNSAYQSTDGECWVSRHHQGPGWTSSSCSRLRSTCPAAPPRLSSPPWDCW